MREGLLDILRCPACKEASFRLGDAQKDEIEIRSGNLLCRSCKALYRIDDGIVNFLKDPAPNIRQELDAIDTEEYFQDEEGKRYRVDRDSIQKFREQFLLLPEGDSSKFFKRGGCFQSIRENSHRFYGALKKIDIKPGMTILSLGDGFGYASYRFAHEGCSVVALDIGKYLFAADLYIKNAYFERVFSDMHDLPFKDNAFDIVFCSAVLHHSKRLKDAFSEIFRALRPKGNLVIINESSRGILEKPDSLFDELEKRGYSDTAYTIPEWLDAARASGFGNINIEFLSLADDYIVRQENKNARLTLLLRFAYFLRRHRYIERALLFLAKWPRVLFRPKSWRMVCIR